jgi:hypothetical protein
VRFILRKTCRKKVMAQLRSPPFLSLLAFGLLLMVYALLGIVEDSVRLRLLGKPAIIVATLALFLFVWSHEDQIDKSLLQKMVFGGIFIGLSGLLLTFAWGYVIVIFVAPENFPRPVGMFSVHEINNELKILAIFAFIAAVGTVPHKRTVTIALPLFLLLISYFTIGSYFASNGELRFGHFHSEMTQFGIPLALLVFVLASRAPVFMTNLFFCAIIFVLVNAPWIFQLWYRFIQAVWLPRAHELLVRGEIWDAAARQSLHAPLFGHGLDSTRYLQPLNIDMDYYNNPIVWHPHNMFLQLWLDTGFLGVLVITFLLLLGWRAAIRFSVSSRPAILAGLMMLTVFTLVTHSLWQTWSMAMISFVIVQISLLTAPADKA